MLPDSNLYDMDTSRYQLPNRSSQEIKPTEKSTKNGVYREGINLIQRESAAD